ncbi:MAG: molybdopterin-synthase adenylyltransferase MoeB [Pseudomonadota bacterium]|nr:molybdopterin-synthase adenylyltransferase MoeB [Pseudomonadota bacterium]
MVAVLAIAVLIWGFGAILNVPVRARMVMLGLLYLGVLILLSVLPDGHPMVENLGGTRNEWLVLGGAVALVYGYRWALGHLRARARTDDPAPEVKSDKFTATELERYARHIVLREVGGPGQKRLKNAKVLVIGAGGLGSPALMYLAAAGVGTIGVVDDDTVDLSNLQRQIIHTDDRLDMPKVFSAQEAMLALNPHITVRPYQRRMDADTAVEIFEDYDLILDGTDNFDTRYMVNRAAVAAGKPLISAAITQWEGQIGLYDPARDAPCYECVFPKAPAAGLAPSCAEAGVMGALPGVVGSMMAVEAIKDIVDAGQSLRGRLQFYDALYGENRQMTVKRRADCPVCGDVH